MAFAVLARWTAKDGEEENVLAAIRQLAAPSRAEPGCLLWLPNRDPEDPRSFVVYEQYADRSAFEAHRESDHFQRWGAGDAIPRLESREVTFYETIEI